MSVKRRRLRASTYALLGSVVLHGLVVVWLLTRPAPAPRRSTPQPVEFELFTPMAVAPSAQEAPSLEAPQPLAAPQQKTRKSASEEPLAPEQAAAPAEPAPSSAEVSTSQGVVAAPRELAVVPPSAAANAAPGRPMNLSPLAAALTMRAELEAESSCGAPAGSAAHCAAAGNEASTGGAPSELAIGPRSLIAMRKELKLKPQSDGSYAYDAPSFSAIVTPDGRVSFEDKIQDLNAVVERMVGVQVNTAEKRRFMESTAALREQLADAAEAQNQRRAKVTLRHTLEVLIGDARKSLTQKRAIIFGMWDDCASDASGSEAQAAIEHFVRERLPRDSALAYSATELAQLNQRRVSRRVFDPYAAGDAGVRPG